MQEQKVVPVLVVAAAASLQQVLVVLAVVTGLLLLRQPVRTVKVQQQLWVARSPMMHRHRSSM
jgi:glucose uptake protein GlcU